MWCIRCGGAMNCASQAYQRNRFWRNELRRHSSVARLFCENPSLLPERNNMATTTHIDNAALFAILSSLADNKRAIGRRYAFWSNGAPALEAPVAAAAMTQDELGHARTLYPLLEDFVQAEADPDQVEPMTRALHYHVAFLDQDFRGWADFVATNFLLD